MVKTFSKAPAARQLEARARARTLGVHVAVVVEARRYVSASQAQPGTIYAIERTPAGWACSCEGYEHTGICKHLGAVERRAEREGWVFGQLAALAKVARYFPLDIPENVITRGAVLAVAETGVRESENIKGAIRSRITERQALDDLFGAAAD